MPSDIQNPRRILAVALTSSRDHLSSIIGKLTGTFPAGEFAGSTHDLTLDTPYYRAQVPVWLDLVGEPEEAETDTKKETEKSPYDDSDDEDENDPVQTWADAFLADEAAEVREALGGIVAIVDAGSYKQQKSLVNHVGRLARGCAPKEEGEDAEEMQGLTSWDGVGLVVGVSATPLDDDAMLAWDDACVEAGLEFVLVAPGQADVNEWGEKTGVERVLEALKANDWQGDDGGGDAGAAVAEIFGDDAGTAPPAKEWCNACKRPHGYDFIVTCGNLSSDEESIDFAYDRSDTEGLRQAIWEQQNKEIEDDEEVKKDDKKDAVDKKEDKADKEKAQGDDKDDDDMDITKLVQKLQAAKMQGELLPPAQRRALAARVVSEVMKEI